MNESLGGTSDPSEEAHNTFDFDQEWAEFNQDLVTEEPTLEEQAETARVYAEANACRDHVWERLYEKDIARVVDHNTDNEITFFADFTTRYCLAKVEEYQFADYEITDDLERQMALSCIVEYFNEREFEANIINTSAVLIYMATNLHASEESRQYVQDLKKQLQAELFVHFGRGLHDPWQQLLDELVPGESLDMTNFLDMPYVIMAKVTKGQFDAERTKRDELVGIAVEIIGVDVKSDEASDIAQVYYDLINMQIDASEPVYTETERANRNAGLREFVRYMGLPQDVAKKIVELFDEAYPILPKFQD